MLHPQIALTEQQQGAVNTRLSAIALDKFATSKQFGIESSDAASMVVPMTTVSKDGNFDAFIEIVVADGPPIQTMFDTGNNVLILPDFDVLRHSPGFAKYQDLGDFREPFGCPARLLRGPISIAGNSGVVEIASCVFYACKGPNSEGRRTANFGAGMTSPWTVVPGVGAVLSPLAYLTRYPYVEIDFAPAAITMSFSIEALIRTTSRLKLSRILPAGYTTFQILPNTPWMAMRPMSISLGGVRSGWPDTPLDCIAMIDTGGGPVFLSDPTDHFGQLSPWPEPAPLPWWSSDPRECRATAGTVSIELSDGASTYAYTIDTHGLPNAVQGFTLLACKECKYMWGWKGMNIGGVSALFNTILIDYAAGRVGLKPKP